MFLSRVHINPQALTPKNLMPVLEGDSYRNHQLLWRLFTEEDERPFLFRQEFEHSFDSSSGKPRGLPLFYVLSRVEPQADSELFSCEVKSFEPKLSAGQQLAFKLRANPVVAKREEGRKNSRHHDVLMDAKRAAKDNGVTDKVAIRCYMDEAAQSWLANKGRSEKAGYTLQSAPEVSGYQQHVHRRKGRDIRFSSVDFQGILTVNDPERFAQSLAEGIGRSRAFGCGMWMVRRV
ncbi:type I-E CRISPR-associated protein Cas6/Cse3/CasE [Halorhodospira halochloris]|uniref:CRISPR-associated protein n=1 Tax=Halorhodospira halochloris TaxID=1052 RepID=A0A0X8XC07_HALHR|nr:type I-E CRISPR-associated protein Cas6/Cse3/CasE [Halorhodospira halochloris]MBK1651145.1 type I-E CRISPR-associated protein Cas6/Cse3/CasE [Halorhodospira halochloris]MCG5531191.1 type I-E CRISPR-associated protein Cas6/Cse3/CasE [Halorhodospira halochloris]BAU57414.1 CRISPR-associated protein [Halorhodospira halochloris]